MRRWLALGAVAGLWLATPAVAQQQTEFSAGGVRYQVTLPQGYCASDPVDMDAENADLRITVCGDAARERDFFSVKLTPGFGNTVKTREALFAQLRPLFEAPDAEARFAALTDQATQARGVDLEGGWKPMGMDDVCAYLGAQVAVQGDKGRETFVQGICVTVIGGQIFAIYSTGRGATVQDLARQVRASKALALAIRDIGAAPPSTTPH